MTRALYSLSGADERRFFSPHCWKAVMALAHKGLDFEEIPTTYARIRAIGGGVSSIVPVLDDNGRLIPDSFDIALYLEETYPERPSLFMHTGDVLSRAKFATSGLSQVTLRNFEMSGSCDHNVFGQGDDIGQRERVLAGAAA